MNKVERLEIVNNLIMYISKRGRRFFYCKSKDRTAHMKLRSNRVYYVDDYTGQDIYAYSGGIGYDHFSHGGTLWALVLEFSEFIRHGGNVNGKHGYGGLYSQHWGYDEQSHLEIIEYAKQLGYLK